jgi:hypothetical protein
MNYLFDSLLLLLVGLEVDGSVVQRFVKILIANFVPLLNLIFFITHIPLVGKCKALIDDRNSSSRVLLQESEHFLTHVSVDLLNPTDPEFVEFASV